MSGRDDGLADLTSAEYAVYGVLAAAKIETGPGGARRAYRIWDRLSGEYSEEEIEHALVKLMERAWVRQLSRPVMGMIHYYYEADPDVPRAHLPEACVVNPPPSERSPA